MNVTVVGMGKIGLPLAVNFARHNVKVTGLDIQSEVVDLINAGLEPFPGEKDLLSHLRSCVKNKSLSATTDTQSSLSGANVIVVCIPLIVGEDLNPDFANIDQLARQIGSYISNGTLICFETTLPVGTTKNRFSKIIEATSGLRVGIDFYVVFSPERVLTGRVFEDLRKYPKLVGGVTDNCTDRGVSFYSSVLDFDPRPDLNRPNGVWAMQNSEAAEFAKLAETTYRDVNIGLANEFAVYARSQDIDILEVIEASNSQPFSHLHTPGISVGGHCIPVYPRFYMWGNEESQIVSAARTRNLSMPIIAISQIEEKVGQLNGLKIGILGITYRPGVKETAFSGAFDLLKVLMERGAHVSAFDPFYSDEEVHKFGFTGNTNLEDLDGIIIHTNHDEFLLMNFDNFPKLKFIYDGRRQQSKWFGSEKFKYLTY